MHQPSGALHVQTIECDEERFTSDILEDLDRGGLHVATLNMAFLVLGAIHI